jgi:NAD(P)-dependent dehydrogenase (short-subunit alcohol dehydrogenase family)
MTAGRLADRVAVITGGTTGIGLATAELFAAEGAQVVVTGTNPDTLEVARRRLAGRAEVRASDASSSADLEQLAGEVREHRGRVDVLFLNAGVARYGLITSMPEAALDECWRVNFKGPWLAIRAFAPAMTRGGSIVLNTSITNQLGQPYTSAYAATKAALRSLARTAAAELAGSGIRVNAVSPGVTDTPIHGKAGIAEAVRGMASRIPLGRLAHAEEVAHAVLFLASSDSRYVTGEELVVDGGMTLRTSD